MQILVACEESQAVTIALRKLGHEAYSCDLIPCSGGHPEWHIQQDVLPLLNGYCFFKTCDGSAHYVLGRWDMLIAFPPCTYLTNASAVRMRVKGEIVAERYAKAMEFQAIYDLRDDMLPIFQQHGIKCTTLYPDNPFLYDMLELMHNMDAEELAAFLSKTFCQSLGKTQLLEWLNKEVPNETL